MERRTRLNSHRCNTCRHRGQHDAQGQLRLVESISYRLRGSTTCVLVNAFSSVELRPANTTIRLRTASGENIPVMGFKRISLRHDDISPPINFVVTKVVQAILSVSQFMRTVVQSVSGAMDLRSYFRTVSRYHFDPGETLQLTSFPRNYTETIHQPTSFAKHLIKQFTCTSDSTRLRRQHQPTSSRRLRRLTTTTT